MRLHDTLNQFSAEAGAPLRPTFHSDNAISNAYISEEHIAKSLPSARLPLSCGHDGISACLIKSFSDALFSSPDLHTRTCLKTRTFPMPWTISRASPINKYGSTTDVKNYSPTSLLCPGSKIFEFIQHTLIACILRNSLMPNEHGLIPGR